MIVYIVDDWFTFIGYGLLAVENVFFTLFCCGRNVLDDRLLLVSQKKLLGDLR